MNFIFPIILIIISGGLFYIQIDPTYKQIKEDSQQAEEYNSIISKTTEIRKIREEQRSKLNSITSSDRTKLEKILPDHIDNIQLILDIQQIAYKYSMPSISDVSIVENNNSENGKGIVAEGDELYDSVGFSFSVISNYSAFKNFIKDLDKSLRIMDIQSISFSKLNLGQGESLDVYKFNVEVRTYWSK